MPAKSISTEHERAATMLQDFGLSESETAVYIALLEAGRKLKVQNLESDLA